jgi:UDP-N-acetylglucosamine 3-dehydrogenase
MRNMNLAVVGVGGWGKNHLRVLHELGVLTAFCDADPTKIEEYEKKYDVKGYGSLDELLKTERLDGITVCTPTSTHYAVAEKTISQGLHTFVEKPLTPASGEGEKLLALAEKHMVKLTSGYIERFNPAVTELKSLLRSNTIGEPLLLEFHRESKWSGRILDVGIITDTSVHDIDTARWIFDSEPKMVFARTGQVVSNHEDFAAIILGFNDQKTAFITSNWVTPKRVRELVAVCTGGIATINFVSQSIIIDDKEGSRTPRHEWQEPLKKELQGFIECIDRDYQPLVTGRDAVNTTKIAEAALVSSRSGAPIYLDF